MPQEQTTLGPLVESWQYPNRCRNLFVSCTTCSRAWQAQKCGDEDAAIEGVVDDIGCWPPTSMKLPSSYSTEYQRTWMQTSTTVGVSLPLKGWGIYYPANQCPDGYIEACWGEGSETGDFDFQFSVCDNERVKGCCPFGYKCAKAGGHQTCTSVTSKGEVQIAMCDGTSTILSDLTLPASISGARSLEAITLYAPMIQAVSGERDAGELASANSRIEEKIVSATSRAGIISRPASSSSTTSASFTISSIMYETVWVSNSGPWSGLSRGAQAGIGVGVSVVGLGILAAAGLLWRRRRRRSKVNDEVTYDKPQLDSREVTGPSELGTNPPQYTHGTGELDGTSARQELNGSTPTRHELP